MNRVNLYTGDCLDILKTLEANSVDAVITDPPYGLSDHPERDVTACLTAWLKGDAYRPNKRGFMGHSWDAWVPGPEVWKEVHRVLKPGGHLAVFAGSRTHDLMSIGLRIAGFELKDTLMWIYSQGFPKSFNVKKAIEKSTQSDAVANEWAGWGTALKPAFEPILLFRKPLQGTIAQNVLAHHTGALNIDACRVAIDDTQNAATDGIAPDADNETPRGRTGEASAQRRYSERGSTNFAAKPGPRGGDPAGRWPANVILDGSDEVISHFPQSTSGAMKANSKRAAQDEPGSVCYGTFGGNITSHDIGKSEGSAARFFYCPKISRKDRHEGLNDPGAQFKHGVTLRQIENVACGGNNHPTVKPTALMRWLVRLITPPHGMVLDPFMGSGSTGKAALLENKQFTGIEMNPDWLNIAKARIDYAIAAASDTSNMESAA